eukprot:791441-Pelagomonas_calceolata.AAC.4
MALLLGMPFCACIQAQGPYHCTERTHTIVEPIRPTSAQQRWPCVGHYLQQFCGAVVGIRATQAHMST